MNECKLLILGNGFDIAHALPTKYSDFMDFIDGKDIVRPSVEYDLQQKMLRILECKDMHGNSYLHKNILYDFIDSKRRNRQMRGQNWVDFEQEIQVLVRSNEVSLKKLRAYEEGLEYREISAYTRGENVSPEILEECLDRLICAFEIYIAEYVNTRKIHWYTNDIKPFEPDYVLTFNYSNTFERHYGGKFNVEYCYIHGKAEDIDCKGNKLDNHLVLGIDEYLPEDEVAKYIDYSFSRKYFQRILKGTGTVYKNWLYEIGNNNASKTIGPHKIKLQVMIFGHSLSNTDGDILREILCKDYAWTTIYYHSKDALKQQIANLITVLGKDKLIEMCYSAKPRIVFKQQGPRESICDA